MKKLLLFFALLPCLAYSQVYYVDVNPDSCVCVTAWASKSTAWDLDKDGTNDFNIDVYSNGNSGGNNEASIAALQNNSVAGDSQGAFALSPGDTLNTQTSWRSGIVRIEYCGFTGYQGHWQAVTNKYLGVRFYSGSILYYAWISVHVGVGQAATSVLVKNYAYSTCSTDCLTQIQEAKVDNPVLVYPNPSNGIFKIESGSESKGVIQVTNILGETVIQSTFDNKQASIDISNYPKGIYFLKVLMADGEIAVRKIVYE